MFNPEIAHLFTCFAFWKVSRNALPTFFRSLIIKILQFLYCSYLIHEHEKISSSNLMNLTFPIKGFWISRFYRGPMGEFHTSRVRCPSEGSLHVKISLTHSKASQLIGTEDGVVLKAGSLLKHFRRVSSLSRFQILSNFHHVNFNR